ncbi:MAG: hypothetical protein ACKPCM_07000 [Pseudanabaena sp.]
MYQRINITLPNETLQLLDRIAPKGDHSFNIRYVKLRKTSPKPTEGKK